jgi:zinc protease
LARLKISSNVGGRGGRFQTTKPNIVPAIHLIAQVLREPAFPQAEFEQLKKLLATSIESQLSIPGPLASATLAQQFNIYPKGDVRYSPSLQEALDDVKAVTLDDVKRFYKTFYSGNHAQVAIVGDFDEAEVIKAITEGLADWQSATPYTRVTSQYKDIATSNRAIETPDKENAVFLARINVDVNEDDADYPALFLANYMLGGGAGFDSRLVGRIRVKEGLSYAVSSALVAGRFDRAGRWMVQASAAPQNIDKVEAAFKDELANVLKDGFTPEQVAAAKSGIMQVTLQSRAQDQRLVAELLSDIDTDRTFAWDKQFEGRIAALTPEEVLEVTRKYIDPARITIIKAGDFAKIAKAK